MTTRRVTLRVKVGNKVIVAGDPMTHVVRWEDYRSFDTRCGLIIEDYQPAYYYKLLDTDARKYDPRATPAYRVSEDATSKHPALQLQVAPDDAPITCVQCLCARLVDQRDVFDDVDA